MSPRTAGLVLVLVAACSGTAPDPRPDVSSPELRASAEAEPSSRSDSPPAAAVAPPPPRAASDFGGAPPQWIWSSPNPGEHEVVVLERSFEVPRPITRATMRASADNHLRVFVNGELVGAHDEWEIALVVDVGAYVRRGENVLSLVAQNGGGSAGAWAELVVEDPDGRRVRVATDGSWIAHALPDDAVFALTTPSSTSRARTGPAHAFGAFGVGPWFGAIATTSAEPASPSAPEEELGHALAASAIQVPAGFRVELVHEVPRSSEGSWVTMAEDPRGRIYVSDQHGRLFRVTPAAIGADAATTRVEAVAVDIGSAHGLCWAFDSLYVVVSERDPGRVTGLYRLRDTDGDDQLDSSELLRELRGNGEHGPHAVRLGPDGALWIVAGNHTDLPELSSSRVPRAWGEDNLLPRIDDPGGHAVGRMAPGGWIARTDENGREFELYTAGFRNAYDFAFDPLGELFTFDSDMEWDVGAPWYRPTRILHAVSGADFGWRNGSTKWPADSIDTWPSVCDMGRSSPTGVEFGTRAKFPAKWRRALYACDWSFGTIYAVHLEADGASWRGKPEVFARGEPFQVTDAMVAQGGAMYVTTGGRNTRSAMYRITWAGAIDEPAGRADALSVAQKRRRALEQLHVESTRTPEQLQAIQNGLGSLDRFIAGAARVALEFTPAPQWEMVWSDDQGARSCTLAAVAALHSGKRNAHDILERIAWLVSSTRPEPHHDVLARDLGLDDLRVVELALTRLHPTAEWEQAVAVPVARGFAGRDARFAREAAVVLAFLDSPGIVDEVLTRIDASVTQEDAIHFAYCLRVVQNGWTREQRLRFLDFLDGRARTFTGGESLTKYVTRIREDFIARLPEDERVVLADRIAPPKPKVVASAQPAAFVRRWTRPELEKLLAATVQHRSFDGGKQAFATATCTQCHRIGDTGGATGPDLTSTAARFGIPDMLDAMLEPSKTISDQYRDTEFRTVDGDLLVGRVEAEKDGVIRLRRAPSDEVVDIDESDVEMRRPYPLSRMPNGLLDTLDEEGVLDLFAYLRSGGSASHAAFQSH
jgi:putative heme-binding domain-containing protein